MLVLNLRPANRTGIKCRLSDKLKDNVIFPDIQREKKESIMKFRRTNTSKNADLSLNIDSFHMYYGSHWTKRRSPFKDVAGPGDKETSKEK